MILAATQIYGSHGGIPCYMRRLSEIFSVLSREEERTFFAVSLIDSGWDPGRHSNPVRYCAFHGCAGNRARFLRRLFGLAVRRPAQVLVLGHVALAPVAHVLRSIGLVRSYVIVLHGIEAWKPLRAMERIACKSAQQIIATTRFTKDRFVEVNRIAADRVSVVPLAIERSSIEEGDSLHCGSTPLRALFVGRLSSLERYKGLDELLEAMAVLARESLQVQLQVVGAGDDRSRLIEKARSLGVGDLVEFSGALGPEELAAAYRRCDLFAMPSDGEGFGMAFLEAMSYGKPSLGARSGGVPEVIDHGEDGFLVNYGDVSGIAACLRRLDRERGLLAKLGQKAQNKVRDKYLFPTMLANWRDLMHTHAGA